MNFPLSGLQHVHCRSNVFLQTIGNILYRYATIPDAIMTAIVYEKNNLISALKLFIASLPRP